ncbi:uncharacterized protein LOC131874942 [Cryptomeria japonica]|uniref:uncharacterized protein LOC131874942 n=1 Tax=Cryptomeria japonica TaxID=3369 RepID=UPI0027DA4531|nr:uncharacterized protein LOC131874942 [Cryptomeria japonica]
MKILSWNVRGLGAPDKRRMVKHHLSNTSCDIIMLQETKLSCEEGERFVRYCKRWEGRFQMAEGNSGGLGIVWNPDKVLITEVSGNKNWMTCMAHNRDRKYGVRIWNVYGPTGSDEKTKLWGELEDSILKCTDKKFIVGGDFNAILDLTEKRGGSNRISKEMLEFKNFVRRIEATDCIPVEGWFTWTNRRQGFTNIAERLDRFLVGEGWILEGIPTIASTLPISTSDHYPLQMDIGTATQGGGGYFKFQNMWWREKSLKSQLEQWWMECKHIQGTPSFCFVKKLLFVKNKLKIWNRDVFKNIFEEKDKIGKELEKLNLIVMEKGMTSIEFEEEKRLKNSLNEILAREEIYWRDKARELWIREGDKNTKFFHA